MPHLFTATLFAILAGCVAIETMPPATAQDAWPVSPSFDIAMPAVQAPFDTTVITAMETVGAPGTE